MAMLPDDPEGLNKLKKKGGAVSEEQPAEGDDTQTGDTRRRRQSPSRGAEPDPWAISSGEQRPR